MRLEYILADDLSGALEAGAAFRMRGQQVTLSLGATASDVSPGLRVLSSETRNARPAEAGALTRGVLTAQRAAGWQLLFKKIDSTLRGPVGAEVKALIEVLSPPLVVVCPANPAVGRTMRDGRLLVHGVAVSESEFRNDPGSPATESCVATVLSDEGVGSISRLSLTQLRSMDGLDDAEARGVLVSDAESADDLLRLVRLVREREPGAVFVGSGGLAQALAADSPMAAAPGCRDWAFSKSALIVSGSMSAKSRRQLEVLRDRHGVPLHAVRLTKNRTARHVAADVARSLAQFHRAGLTVAGNGAFIDPSEPVKWLTAVVSTLDRTEHQLPEILAATGGETARALCTALEIDQLELVDELEPGVVVARVAQAPKKTPRWLIIKPGGFGSEDVWLTIFRNNSASKMK